MRQAPSRDELDDVKVFVVQCETGFELEEKDRLVFRSRPVGIVRQIAVLLVVDEIVVPVLRLAADREEIRIQLSRLAQLLEYAVLQPDRIVLDIEVLDRVDVSLGIQRILEDERIPSPSAIERVLACSAVERVVAD